MLHKQKVREKKSFALQNVGSGNINLGKDIAKNLILMIPVLIYYDSVLCVLQLSGIFVWKNINITHVRKYVRTYIRADCFGLTNDWDYKNVCTKKKRLRDYFTENFKSKN